MGGASAHQRREKEHWPRSDGFGPTIAACFHQDRTCAMKIVDIREKTVPISSPIRNAYIDFSKMTLSLVAVVTDVVRDGKPVVGYGFNSNGRYGQGQLMRERFMPAHARSRPGIAAGRQRRATSTRTRSGPRCSRNEKPGGHGERSVAIGTIDMAVWDAVAKIEGKPLFQLLADRYGDGTPNRKVFVYAAGGYYYPGKDDAQLKDEMRSYLDRGYSVVKMKIGGASLAEDLRRIESVLSILRRRPAPVRGRQRPLRPGHRHRLRQGAVAATTCSGTRKPATRSTTSCRPTLRNYYAKPMATGENLFSMQDARNLIRYGGMRPDRDWLQFDCALSYGLVEYLRTLDMLQQHGWSPSALHSARRPPDVADHRGRPGPGRQRVLPRPVPALRRLPRRRAGGGQLRHPARAAGHRLRGQGAT